MSRSNNSVTVNPASRWYQWNGEKGMLKYWDKEKEVKVEVPFNMTFILLDQLSTITGWNDPSESSLYSNEIRDSRYEPLVVKAFKAKSVIAQGLYSDIKDKVGSAGGDFTSNLYMMFKNETGEFVIGVLQLKGAALNAWVDFNKKYRADIYKKAIKIEGTLDGKKGSVNFKTPVFKITDVSEATEKKALELDVVLQAHMTTYLSKKIEQHAATAEATTSTETTATPMQPVQETFVASAAAPRVTDIDDLPF